MIDFTDSKLVEEDGSPQICQIFTDVKANENTDNDIDPQSFTSDVPILALRNMVLFPNFLATLFPLILQHFLYLLI